MASENVRQVFKNVCEKVRKGQKVSISAEMKKTGYSSSTCKKPGKVTKTKTWQELLKKINEEPLLKKLKEIALADNDKRANIEAIKELLKLKNLYPAGKLKVGAFDERDRIID